MRSALISDTSAFSSWSKILPRRCLVDRDHFLLSMAAGRSVLHLGAADAPFHKQKANRGELLHQKLHSVTSRLIGVDSNCEAVRYLRDYHDIRNIVVADLAAPNFSVIAEDLGAFDLVLCCDIIEHLSDNSTPLSAVKRLMHAGSRLIVTTINALSAKTALRALLGREAVHPDHVSYYSYSTLSRLLIREGFRPIQYATFAYPVITRAAAVLFAGLHRLAPSTADGILVVATL